MKMLQLFVVFQKTTYCWNMLNKTWFCYLQRNCKTWWCKSRNKRTIIAVAVEVFCFQQFRKTTRIETNICSCLILWCSEKWNTCNLHLQHLQQFVVLNHKKKWNSCKHETEKLQTELQKIEKLQMLFLEIVWKQELKQKTANRKLKQLLLLGGIHNYTYHVYSIHTRRYESALCMYI